MLQRGVLISISLVIQYYSEDGYMKRVGILFIAVALAIGMIGCEPSPDPDPTPQYDLAISSTEGGSVAIPGESTYAYDQGTWVVLIATPVYGYRFVSWTGDVNTIGSINAPSTMIRMDDDCSIIANFEAIPPGQYSLTTSSTTGGSVTTPGQGTFWYDAGVVVDLVVWCEEGYKFSEWTGDIETIAGGNTTWDTWHWQKSVDFSITMEGNYTITAHFIPRWS